MCLQKSLRLFLIFFFVAISLNQNCLYAGQNSSQKITTSEFQSCLDELESCNKGFEKLEDKFNACAVKADRQKILFFLDAESIGYLALGVLVGVVL